MAILRVEKVGAEVGSASGAAASGGSSSVAVDLARLVERLRRTGALRGGADMAVSRFAVPVAGEPAGAGRHVKKVSVSIPEDLIEAVQRRAGRGAFSQYVSEAVAQRLEHDLVAELLAMLDDEHGPVPEHMLEQARREWPDAE
jgi:hypothetical protein